MNKALCIKYIYFVHLIQFCWSNQYSKTQPTPKLQIIYSQTNIMLYLEYTFLKLRKIYLPRKLLEPEVLKSPYISGGKPDSYCQPHASFYKYLLRVEYNPDDKINLKIIKINFIIECTIYSAIY